MAKKRQHDDSEEALTPPTHEMPIPQEAEHQPPTESNNPLMEEIQTFMSMRDELAQKLAAEIEATELRLEELKSTAASLFPQNVKSTDDKKPKKPKPKAVKEDKGGDSGTEA